MRTTITLTPEAEALIRQAMHDQGLSFKDAVNVAIVRGMGGGTRPAPATPTFDLGRAAVPVEKALQLAGELEDEELLRKRGLGK